VFVVGGAAGMLAGLLRGSRTTADCDVLLAADDADWPALESAAREAARSLQLPERWLNRDSTMYAWCLPLGWTRRCERVGIFGPLEVLRLARIDLIATKIMSAPRRPQDLEDLRDIRPTADELDFALLNIERIKAEHLDREEFPRQRAIVQVLRGDA
jgi:hypothetical protein